MSENNQNPNLPLSQEESEQLALARARRQERVQGFQINIDFDQQPADKVADGADQRTRVIPVNGGMSPQKPEKHSKPSSAKSRKKKKHAHQTAWRYTRALIYLVVMLAAAGLLSAVILIGALDLTGLNRSKVEVEVTIPEGANAAQVADILYEAGVIDQPWLFRLYVGFTGSGASLQSGTFTVASAYGYSGIIEMLQQEVARETVRVTIPEGFTVRQIAALMEEKNVCSALDFYKAANSRDYDYSFVKEIPSAQSDTKYANRVFLLEGYLFPDTYEFFTESSAETVVNKMLQNFNNKVTTKMRAAIKQKGYTLDEAVILSSIIQSEVGQREDMLKVSRVLFNRLENAKSYPKLQCDSTTFYINKQPYYDGGVPIVVEAYDTYVCKGLPVGAISNPGLLAIEAFISPSTNSAVKSCYYFATDIKTGITYYSRTLAEHTAICKKYDIYGSL